MKTAKDFPLSFKIGCEAQADSGGATLEIIKDWKIPSKFIKRLERCEKFIRSHRRDRITRRMMNDANRTMRKQLKRLGCEVRDIDMAQIGDLFIMGGGGEEAEYENLAKARYKGDVYKEYKNFDNIIDEIFDGDLSGAIEVDKKWLATFQQRKHR